MRTKKSVGVPGFVKKCINCSEMEKLYIFQKKDNP
jgi:hypothetical protein